MTTVTDFRRLIRASDKTFGQAALDSASAQSAAAAAQAKATAAMNVANAAVALAQLSRIDFGVITFNFAAAVSLVVYPQAVTFDVPGAKIGDRVAIYPVSVPTGYAPCGNGMSTADDKVTIYVVRPVLSVLTNVSLSVRAIAYRDPS